MGSQGQLNTIWYGNDTGSDQYLEWNIYLAEDQSVSVLGLYRCYLTLSANEFGSPSRKSLGYELISCFLELYKKAWNLLDGNLYVGNCIIHHVSGDVVLGDKWPVNQYIDLFIWVGAMLHPSYQKREWNFKIVVQTPVHIVAGNQRLLKYNQFNIKLIQNPSITPGSLLVGSIWLLSAVSNHYQFRHWFCYFGPV